MCRMRVDLDELERETGQADLAAHFAQEWKELVPFAEEGLCTLGERRLDVTAKGRLFLRHMAMPFDASQDRQAPIFYSEPQQAPPEKLAEDDSPVLFKGRQRSSVR